MVEDVQDPHARPNATRSLNGPSTGSGYPRLTMIDTLVLALTHGLLLVVAWRLVNSPAVDDDSLDGKPPPPKRGWKRPGA
jgi:hypothetical protein